MRFYDFVNICCTKKHLTCDLSVRYENQPIKGNAQIDHRKIFKLIFKRPQPEVNLIVYRSRRCGVIYKSSFNSDEQTESFIKWGTRPGIDPKHKPVYLMECVIYMDLSAIVEKWFKSLQSRKLSAKDDGPIRRPKTSVFTQTLLYFRPCYT